MWQTAAVELALAGLIILLLVAGLILQDSRAHAIWKLAFGGVFLLLPLLAWQIPWIGQTIDPMFVFDRFACFFKGLFLMTVLIIILMTRTFAAQLRANVGELYLLICTALLGMLVLASVNDLLLLFIGIELLTFSLYVMAAYLKTDARSVEAGLKYLILGSISSGFLVYGISLLYGVTGGTSFHAVRVAFSGPGVPVVANAGMLLILAGLGFKVAAVPFQLWAPDVYEGAPAPVAALLATGSKMAGVVVLIRLLYTVFWPAQALWASLLSVLSAATLLYGNLAAIPQTNIKRLLGYSSIGHAGYLLMGLSTASSAGIEAVGFYLVAYLVSNLTVFFVVVVASTLLGSDSLDAYNGLSKRSPILAAAMFVGLLSLAGVPPLAGFMGKLLVLLATVQAGKLWLVVIGAVNVAISLYYYLMIVRRMYLLPPAGPQPLAVDRLTRVALLVLMGAVVLVGTIQEPVLRLVTAAIP